MSPAKARRLLGRALALGLMLVIAGCGKHAATSTATAAPTPTATPAPVPTPSPTSVAANPNGTNNNGQPVDASHPRPVFNALATLHGAAEGTATFNDDVTGSSYPNCAATTAMNSSGIWQVPWQHSGSTRIGTHTITYTVTLTAADTFAGPGTYTAPHQSAVAVDGTLFTAGPGTTIQVNPDGSGGFTLAGYSSAGQPGLSGTITWTCSIQRG